MIHGFGVQVLGFNITCTLIPYSKGCNQEKKLGSGEGWWAYQAAGCLLLISMLLIPNEDCKRMISSSSSIRNQLVECVLAVSPSQTVFFCEGGDHS